MSVYTSPKLTSTELAWDSNLLQDICIVLVVVLLQWMDGTMPKTLHTGRFKKMFVGPCWTCLLRFHRSFRGLFLAIGA